MSTMKSWRPEHTARPTPGIITAPNAYPATRFFDNLSFIGTYGTCCFMLETSEGIVLLDCINPGQAFINIIETGIRDLGRQPEEIIAILITHGHGDHWGEAAYFKKKYGCKVYMSEIDYISAQTPRERAPWPPFDCPLDGYLEDMGKYTFGDTTITTVHTPGHTAGSMSYLVPVYDEGRPHVFTLWGGAGLAGPDADVASYMDSVTKYKAVCREFHADAMAATHPFIDNSIQKLEITRQICRGVPNPFIVGEDGIEYFMDAMMISAIKEKEEKRKL